MGLEAGMDSGGVDCFRRGLIWRGDGVVAISLAGVLRGFEVSAGHRSDHLGERAAQLQAATFLPTEKKFFLDHWLENLKAPEAPVRPRI